MSAEEAKIQRESIRGDMPPAIRAAVDEIVDGLIANLGESPEAWYGAQAALMDLVSKPIVLAVAEGHKTSDSGDRSVMTLIMLVLGQFLSHPISMANIQLARELRKEHNGGAQATHQADL